MKFRKFNEGFAYVKDPFREGNSIWVKKIRIGDLAAVQLVGSVDGIKGMHCAIVSVHTKSMDNFGEDLAAERFIVHQKDFSTKEEAEQYLRSIESKTKFFD